METPCKGVGGHCGTWPSPTPQGSAHYSAWASPCPTTGEWVPWGLGIISHPAKEWVPWGLGSSICQIMEGFAGCSAWCC